MQSCCIPCLLSAGIILSFDILTVTLAHRRPFVVRVHACACLARRIAFAAPFVEPSVVGLVAPLTHIHTQYTYSSNAPHSDLA